MVNVYQTPMTINEYGTAALDASRGVGRRLISRGVGVA